MRVKLFVISVFLVMSFALAGLAGERTMPTRLLGLLNAPDRIYYSFLPADKDHPLLLMCYKSYTLGENSFDYEEIFIMPPDGKDWYWPPQYPRYYFYDFNGDGRMQDSEVLWDELEDGRNGNEIWLDMKDEKM